MGLDYVDIFYSHRFDPDTPLEETMGALDTAVRSGRALYAGISSYSAEKTKEAYEILRDLGTPLLIHQPSYSMLNRWIEDGLLDTLGKLGVGCIVFSPLAQGMLTDRYLDGIPADSRAAQNGSLSRKMLSDETLERIRALNEIAARPRSVARAACARLGAARRTRYVCADRREQRRSSSRRTSPHSTSSTSPTTSSRRSTTTRSTRVSTSGRLPAASEPTLTQLCKGHFRSRSRADRREGPYPFSTRSCPCQGSTSSLALALACALAAAPFANGATV